ncbi:MAG: PASTA domain-containing protein [Atopobiaceae bacterium]|nr:PASTA domain-containing protein [Atopobiaceae bacterium]
MRCPQCGADNATDASTCAKCGASLDQSQQDATVAVRSAESEVTRMIEEETRLLDMQTRRLVDVPTDDEDEQDEPPEEPKQATPSFGDSVPGIIPVDSTAVHPRAKQSGDDYLYVRNTRDYDHDAQSSNTVVSTKRFETISEKRSRFDGWRDPYARSRRDGRTPGEGNSTSKLRPLLGLLLVLAIVGGGGAILTYGMELWGGKTVPSVVGDSQGNAEQKIVEKGLSIRIEAQPADDAIGKVLSQSPQSGTRIPDGSEVTIVVATNRTIPEVIGFSEDDARATLQASGAEQIEVQPRPSVDAVGLVVEVDPPAGTPFVSRNLVTLYVGVPYTVPDVVGMKESEAIERLNVIGYAADVHYVPSSEEPRTVIETVPAFNEVFELGNAVQVMVSSPFPSSPLHLAEFFSHSSQDVNTYLQQEGYAFDRGFKESSGNAVASYVSGENGAFTFSPQPYARSVSWPQDGSSNVLEEGAAIAGVRFDFPLWQAPAEVNRETVETLAGACGFEGLNDYCDNGSMKLPAGTKPTTATFGCASGKMGDCIWTALVVNENGASRAVATCTREGMYSSSDLAPFDGSVCRFVAYQDVFQAANYQPKSPDESKDAKPSTAG